MFARSTMGDLRTEDISAEVNMHGWPFILVPLCSSSVRCGISKCVWDHRSLEPVFLEQSFFFFLLSRLIQRRQLSDVNWRTASARSAQISAITFHKRLVQPEEMDTCIDSDHQHLPYFIEEISFLVSMLLQTQSHTHKHTHANTHTH